VVTTCLSVRVVAHVAEKMLLPIFKVMIVLATEYVATTVSQVFFTITEGAVAKEHSEFPFRIENNNALELPCLQIKILSLFSPLPKSNIRSA
jgi:hypothetical protein